tara:strand:+ start:13838 stop:14068 length:231 start_codon:yes stop_codon:yes gene_type:complete
MNDFEKILLGIFVKENSKEYLKFLKLEKDKKFKKELLKRFYVYKNMKLPKIDSKTYKKIKNEVKKIKIEIDNDIPF